MPTPAPRLFWEDFPVDAVREFGGLTVGREAIVDFAGRYDPQPFHLDDEAGRASLFGGLTASGWHTCALLMRMMCDDFLVETAALGSPGIDELRWLRPVRPGDTLRVRMVIRQAREMASRPGVGLVQQHFTVTNQAGEAVLTMLAWAMLRRRPAGAVSTG